MLGGIWSDELMVRVAKNKFLQSNCFLILNIDAILFTWFYYDFMDKNHFYQNISELAANNPLDLET